MANLQRYYHSVRTLDDAKEALRQLTDQNYDLRDRADKQDMMITSLTKKHEETKSTLQRLQSGVNTQISGINVSGSPTSTNIHLQYNPATGQLEWMP